MDKERIFEIVNMFGLEVIQDSWDWQDHANPHLTVHIGVNIYKDFNTYYLYKENSAAGDEEYLCNELQEYLIKFGEYKFKKRFHRLMDIKNETI